MKYFALAAVLFLLPLEAMSRSYYYVVIGTSTDQKTAVKLVKRVASKLNIPLDKESLKNPPKIWIHIGYSAGIHSPDDKVYVVTDYMDEEEKAAKEMRESVLKKFPEAYVQKVEIDESEIDREGLEPIMTSPRQILILGSKKKYKVAAALAEKISRETGVPYSTRGMIIDEKRGLIWPDNDEDIAYAGSYWGRRYHGDCDGDPFPGSPDPCLTIERSDFYDGFSRNFYIIVAGIYGMDDPEAETQLKKFQKKFPDAYIKTTKIYMGCIH